MTAIVIGSFVAGFVTCALIIWLVVCWAVNLAERLEDATDDSAELPRTFSESTIAKFAPRHASGDTRG